MASSYDVIVCPFATDECDEYGYDCDTCIWHDDDDDDDDY
jgi:hypothetical protein